MKPRMTKARKRMLIDARDTGLAMRNSPVTRANISVLNGLVDAGWLNVDLTLSALGRERLEHSERSAE